MTVMGHTFQSSTPQSRLEAADADAARFQGVFGATLGLMLGLAGGLSRRSPRAATASALLGAAVGALCGLAALRVALPFYHRHQYTISNDLVVSLAMHGLPFALAGAAAGLRSASDWEDARCSSARSSAARWRADRRRRLRVPRRPRVPLVRDRPPARGHRPGPAPRPADRSPPRVSRRALGRRDSGTARSRRGSVRESTGKLARRSQMARLWDLEARLPLPLRAWASRRPSCTRRASTRPAGGLAG